MIADIPVHPVSVLPITGGTTGHPIRPGDRHVVAGLHPGGDAHGRAAVQRGERGGPDEQDRRGAGHAAQATTRPGAQDAQVLRQAARLQVRAEEEQGR